MESGQKVISVMAALKHIYRFNNNNNNNKSAQFKDDLPALKPATYLNKLQAQLDDNYLIFLI